MAKKASPRAKSTDQADTAGPESAPAKPRARRAPRVTPAASASDSSEGNAIVADSVGSNSSVSLGWEPSEEEIRVRAYHRYLERGGSHGMDFEDWLEAERELKQRK